jgi:hypothetical protein
MLHQQSAYAKKGNAGLVPIATSGDNICGGIDGKAPHERGDSVSFYETKVIRN